MTRILLVGLLALLAACGTPDAGWGEPTPEPRNVEVRSGVELGLTAADRIWTSFTPGVWTGVIDGDTVRLRQRFLVGEEGGITRTIAFDASVSPPAVIGGATRFEDAYADGRETKVDSGVVELQSFDIDGVIAGRWTGDQGTTFDFWVDLNEGSYADAELGAPFELAVGGYATYNDTLVIQFSRILEDSRCSPDVVCVWEGRFAVELLVWNIEDAATLELDGVATDGGPVWGEQPTGQLRTGLDITIVDIDDVGTVTFELSVSS